MTITLSHLFPGIESGTAQIGFFFGAGASREAGYPMMGDLTDQVINKLIPGDRSTLDEILARHELTYNEASRKPNIEDIADFVIEHWTNTQSQESASLEHAIRKHITDILLSIHNPDLTHHLTFLDALRRRFSNTATCIYIITTNYDLLFELAADELGIPICNGFTGKYNGRFDSSIFDLMHGHVNNSRFIASKGLRIHLLKLHGSLSWFNTDKGIIDTSLDITRANNTRAIILPRRRKVLDTLSEPFDQLFTHTSRALGQRCKYVVSCGFSFADKHINDQLILPRLRDSHIRLFALCGESPDCLDTLKTHPAFHAGFPDKCWIDQKYTGAGTNLWQFSSLAKILQG